MNNIIILGNGTGNFQCQGILLIWMTVRQGLTVLAVGAGGVYLDIFFSHIVMSLIFLPLSGRQLDLDLNQLLQLCTPRTACSDSDIRAALV